ncbi:urease accessory protein UreF [Alkalihalobacillus sp. BA299]|uniref:urease accessory protein UreF n=1 Tax=Alkalihalobacillus sp. BA299 TaxID=2815938 RepID=UPI001ADAD6B0|nr:urease accessory protein UreF [Alkalihalobacillus sp. BA299]
MKRKNDASKNHLNTKDITTINPNFLHFLQIHDSAFPIGAYTHSFGMETYIQSGKIKDKGTLIEYCKTYLFTNLICGDGIFVKEAYSLAFQEKIDELIQLEQLAHAMKIASESKTASMKMGKQFIETVSRLSNADSISAWKKKIKEKTAYGHYAVVYGIYAAHRQFHIDDVLSAFLYTAMSSLIHNAVRAIPLGQTTGVQAIYTLLEPITKAVSLLQEKTIEDLSNSSVGIELASMEHERLHTRLFIS